mgnify:FL=1
MNRGLYGKLAVNNIKHNRQFYLPYLLTGMLTVAFFYTMLYLNYNPGLDELPFGAVDVKFVLGLGAVIIGFFSVIFLFYTNSFIMKRRKKELGIYNILGMEKRHLAKVIFLETFFSAVVAIGGGLVAGIAFSKLMCMLLYAMIGYHAEIVFYVSESGVVSTILLFAGIFMLTFIYNLFQIQLAKPVELLHGSSQGEREPKTKKLMAIVGIVTLAAGYYMAITVDNPVTAVLLFFVAVILVIIGTYFIFMAGSIAVLKFLRKRKSYYYKKKHFVAVSGLIYRMKQNAAGLASICILSTMVLVVISSTVSMYAGLDDELAARYSGDISASITSDAPISDGDALRELVNRTIQEQNRSIKEEQGMMTLTFTCLKENGTLVIKNHDEDNSYSSDTIMLRLITREDYEEAYNVKVPELFDNEVVLATSENYDKDTITVADKTYHVLENQHFTSENGHWMAGHIYYMVVNRVEDMAPLYEIQKEVYGDKASHYYYSLDIDIDGSKEEKIACGNAINAAIEASGLGEGQEGTYYIMLENKAENEDSFKQMYGGFLFLGIFLGILFLMITVLIIFYKQISEGYEDKERFAIMEKVGMSNAEVKKTISAQIRMVFLLPIVTAALHVLAAFPMIRMILAVMNLNNGRLFAYCLLGTIAVFTVIYLLVYKMTSRTYYRIVGHQIR